MLDLGKTLTTLDGGPGRPLGSLLCVGMFPSNTGFAWDFIESLYAGVADRLAKAPVTTWVSYPALNGRPRALEGSSAREVVLPVDFSRVRSVRELVQFVKARDVRVLYMADQPSWHPAYAFLRLSGIRWIVVHAHSSGERTRRTGVMRGVKHLSRALPGALADRVIAVSDFVAQRVLEVDLVPRERISRIWNAVKIPPGPTAQAEEFRARFGLPRDRPLVVCAARAAREKGIQHLLRAFDKLVAPGDLHPRPLLVYMGAGEYWAELESLRQELCHPDDVRMLGYVADASRFLGAATVCVVPSIWQEAFGLAALESMAHGVPIVASAVGGLTEIVVHGQTGMLVPPGDEEALATALRDLLLHPKCRAEIGRRGRQRVMESFDLDDEVEAVCKVVAEGFGGW